MKKFFSFFSTLLLISCLLTGCNNFLKGAENSKKIHESIYAKNSETLTVLFKPTEEKYGTFTPNNYQDCYVSQKIEISFLADSDFGCKEFVVVDKNDNNILFDDVISFSPITTKQVGSLVRYQSTATILRKQDNIQIIPVCYVINDITPPRLEHQNIKVARSLEDFENENFLDTNNNFNKSNSSQFINTYYATHTLNSFYIQLSGYDEDEINDELNVIVTETLLYNKNNTSMFKPYTTKLSTKIKLDDTKKNVFTSCFKYDFFSNQDDGIYQLSFNLQDSAGNISDEFSFYVIKKTQIYSSLDFDITIPNILDLNSMDISKSVFETFTNKFFISNILSSDLFLSKYYQISNVSAYISDASGNYQYVPIQNDNDSLYITLPKLNRNQGIWLKLVITDEINNTKEIVKQVPVSISPSFFVAPSNSIYTDVNNKNTDVSTYSSSYFIYTNSSDDNVHLFTSKNSISLDRSLDSIDDYHYFYCLSYNPNDNNACCIVSNPFKISGQSLINNNNNSKTLTQPFDYTYEIKQNKINPENYDITISIDNWDSLSSQLGIEIIQFYWNSNYSISSREPTFTLYNNSNILETLKFYMISSDKTIYYKFTNIENNYSYNPKTSKEIQCGYDFNSISYKNSSGYNLSGKTYKTRLNFNVQFASFSGNISINNVKLYYTKNYNKIAEEEIYSLDYLTTNNFTYQNPIYTYYFNFKSLDKNLYKFYLYINYDDNEKFLYEFQVDLNLIDSSPLYKYNSSTNIYTPTDSTPVENYRFYLKIDNKGNPTWISSTNESDFNKKFIKLYSFKNYQFTTPIFFYYETSFYNKYSNSRKNILIQQNFLNVDFDAPILIETIYSKTNYEDDISSWELLVPDTQKINTQIFIPDNNLSYDQITYIIDDNNIDFDNYYCAIVHFADGTSKISPIYKKE